MIPNGLTLKDLYNAYMKNRTTIERSGDYSGKKTRERLISTQNEYREIKDVYYQITKTNDRKKASEYIKEVQKRKALDNIGIRKTNKVQKKFEYSYYDSYWE